MRPWLVAAVLPLCLFTAATAPGPQTVFGLTLGEPLSIPECMHRVLAGGTVSRDLYDDNPAHTCYEADIQLRGAPWRRGSVDFPLKQMPLIISFNGGLTLIIDGKLEGLEFDTLGYANAQAIIGELTTKFGRPTAVTKTTSNLSGVAVPTTKAEWKLPSLYVRYLSIDGPVEHGSLRIETEKMHALRRGYEQQQASERTPL